MTDLLTSRPGRRGWLALAGAGLLVAGAGGGAGALALTRPAVAMAPVVATPINALGNAHGIVTIKGRIEGVFGDRVLLRDPTGQALVDVGPRAPASLQTGAALQAQGRYDHGQLHARYLVTADNVVQEVGGPPPPPPHGPGAPPPPPGGPGHTGGPDAPGAPGDHPQPPAAQPAPPPVPAAG